MAGLDDLNKAISDLKNAVPAATTYFTNLQNQNGQLTADLATANASIATLQEQITALQAQVAAGGGSDADVETAAQEVEAQAQALNTAIPPAAAPTT